MIINSNAESAGNANKEIQIIKISERKNKPQSVKTEMMETRELIVSARNKKSNVARKTTRNIITLFSNKSELITFTPMSYSTPIKNKNEKKNCEVIVNLKPNENIIQVRNFDKCKKSETFQNNKDISETNISNSEINKKTYMENLELIKNDEIKDNDKRENKSENNINSTIKLGKHDTNSDKQLTEIGEKLKNTITSISDENSYGNTLYDLVKLNNNRNNSNISSISRISKNIRKNTNTLNNMGFLTKTRMRAHKQATSEVKKMRQSDSRAECVVACNRVKQSSDRNIKVTGNMETEEQRKKRIEEENKLVHKVVSSLLASHIK